MRVLRLCVSLLVASAVLSLAQAVSASMVVRQMNLEQMCLAAGRIFRGTVIGVMDGAVNVGGGELPTITYRMRVDEALKGAFEESRGESTAVLQMIQPRKELRVGPMRRLPMFDDLPTFQRGGDYLILATTPSSVGLSMTVGVGQGAFTLYGKPGEEIAVNGADNIGLYRGMSGAQPSGPVPYSALRAQILSIVGR